jgi:hypothetical protein
MLTYGNTKLRKSLKDGIKIATFSLPAGVTCPRAGVCKVWCYAQVGSALYPSVANHRMVNQLASKAPCFVKRMCHELACSQPDVVRLHDSGDFYSPEYAKSWAEVIRQFPGIIFYAYSKSHQMLQGTGLLELENFVLLPSKGGLDDDKITGNHVKVVPEDYRPGKGEVLGSEDDMDNLMNFLKGKTLCLKAHGARKGKV